MTGKSFAPLLDSLYRAARPTYFSGLFLPAGWRHHRLFRKRGTIENAQGIAAHESPRTTKLYDRTAPASSTLRFEFFLNQLDCSIQLKNPATRKPEISAGKMSSFDYCPFQSF